MEHVARTHVWITKEFYIHMEFNIKYHESLIQQY